MIPKKKKRSATPKKPPGKKAAKAKKTKKRRLSETAAQKHLRLSLVHVGQMCNELSDLVLSWSDCGESFEWILIALSSTLGALITQDAHLTPVLLDRVVRALELSAGVRDVASIREELARSAATASEDMN